MLNLGLRSVGLTRNAVDDEDIKDAVMKCKSISDVQKLAEANPAARPACLDAVDPIKVLLNRITARLQLKGKKHRQLTMSLMTCGSVYRLSIQNSHFTMVTKRLTVNSVNQGVYGSLLPSEALLF